MLRPVSRTYCSTRYRCGFPKLLKRWALFARRFDFVLLFLVHSKLQVCCLFLCTLQDRTAQLKSSLSSLDISSLFRFDIGGTGAVPVIAESPHHRWIRCMCAVRDCVQLKSPKLHCFSTISYATVEWAYVQKTRLTDELHWHQVNNAQGRNPICCKPFVLVLGHTEIGLIFAKYSGVLLEIKTEEEIMSPRYCRKSTSGFWPRIQGSR